MYFLKMTSNLFFILVFWLLSDQNNDDQDIEYGKETKIENPPGLVNPGNICFVNSSLQVKKKKKERKKILFFIKKALSSMKSFREFLNGLDTDFKEVNNGKIDIILVRELRKFLASDF